MNRVVVRAPATVANLGPGFDCLGVALAWHNEIRLERDPSGDLTITAAGQGVDQIPRDGSNLAVRAAAAVLGEPGGLRLHLTNAIPFGRGFGSSAAAIVGGVVAARVLSGEHGSMDREAVLRVASELEGHADNVAPCVLGGAVVVSHGRTASLGAPEGIDLVVCVAPTSLATEAARRALPDVVRFADAVDNAGRAALLTAALATADAELLLDATEDVLHQPARFELMPDSGRLIARLRTDGIAAFLAGAGPSVAALVSTKDAAAEDAVRRRAPDGWEVRRVAIDPAGAVVVESG